MPSAETTTLAGDESLQALLDRIADPSARARPVASPPPAPEDPSTVAAPTVPAPVARGPRPWLSASASLFAWGGGQWLNRQRPLGTLLFALQVLALAVAWCLRASWESWVRLAHLFFVEEVSLRTAAAAAGLFVPALAIGGVVQAYLYAERRPGALPAPRLAILPAVASGLVPGWGQILNGQLGKAVLFLCAFWFGLYVVVVSRLDPAMWTRIDPSGPPIAGVQLSAGALASLVAAGLAWVLAIYDGALTARQRAREA
jgi:hypothetical protein